MSGTSTGELLMRRYLDAFLPFEHIDNMRPDWLCNPLTGQNLEIDRYYPVLKVGFEFNGDQHYRHTDLDSGGTQQRDRIKARLCQEAGVKLIKVQAIDLVNTRMHGLVNDAVHWWGHTHPGHRYPFWLKSVNRLQSLKELNKEATAYRAYLKERFPATVTARAKRSRSKAIATKWEDTHQAA